MLLALLLACGGPDASAPTAAGRPEPTFSVDRASGTVAWRALAALDGAQLRLPAGASIAHDGTFALTSEWSEDERRFRRLRAWRHPLPFRNDMKRPNYAPWGARLFEGGREVPFVNQLEDLADIGWFIEQEQLVLLSIEAPRALELRAPELGEALSRRTFDPSRGLAPAEFVRTEITEGAVTRQGLHLPAGGSAAFRVTMPRGGATLTFGVAPLPDPRAGAALTDGEVRAVVRVDGAVVDDLTVAPDASHVERSVSLVAYAGRTVELTFEVVGTDAKAPGHAVYTSPTVRGVSPDGTAPRRVVVVGVDTLRQDALGTHGAAADRSPELDAWARQFVVFDNAYAPAPRTFPSFRTAFTGRYPLAASEAPALAERLSEQGFRTGGVVANVHLVPRFGFNDGFEHWEYENGARADVQVDRALAWLDAHKDEDSFLFLHLMDPHTWYNAPDPYASAFTGGPRPEILPPTFDRWQVYNLMRRRGFDDRARRWIRGAYEGEVAYTSTELSRFLAALDALPGETVTVVHSDHGEELWEHGGFEHNHSLYDELVRAVLWIRPPGGWAGGPHRVKAPVGLIDLVPTVLDLVGAPLADADTDGTSLRPFVDAGRFAQRDALAAALDVRPLQLGHLMFGTERWGVVRGTKKYILHTTSGREELYDLAADRAEARNLAPNAPLDELTAMRAALAEATGWPVRSAWRVTLTRQLAPLTFTFEAPLADAGVLDPEAARDLRANVEWGEAPKVPASAVGSVTLSDDRRTVSFAPGPEALGQALWFACDGACPSGSVSAEGGAPVLLTEGRLALGPAEVRAATGTLLVPTRSAEDALTAPDAAQVEALRQLGYLDGD